MPKKISTRESILAKLRMIEMAERITATLYLTALGYKPLHPAPIV
jgi:hypothetical protein